MSKNGERIISGLGEVLAQFQRAGELMAQGMEQNAALRQAAEEMGGRIHEWGEREAPRQQEKP